MNKTKRRMGLEQEFFLVDEMGELSHRADEFLLTCQTLAKAQGEHPHCFVPEFVKSMVEINTIPADSGTGLVKEYLKNLRLAIAAGREIGLRLYPLSSYPLPITPIMRDQADYHIQAQTVGKKRFSHAGKCTGTHLHLEVSAGVIDPRVAVSYHGTTAQYQELLNIYNLATALDSLLIALGRACPFYEGKLMTGAVHTHRYRGSEPFGWEGVYTGLPAVGGLMPYADCLETLVECQFSRFHTWLNAMEQAGIDRQSFLAVGGSLLKASWNPIRLNPLGTVEIRCLDSNFPSLIIALIGLVEKAVERVRKERLTVRPVKELKIFQQEGDRLLIPDFDYLSGELLYAAATEGIQHPQVKAYVESMLEWVSTQEGEEAQSLKRFKAKLGHFQTTEAQIREKCALATGEISQAEGLSLVRNCCDQLEAQVSAWQEKAPLTALDSFFSGIL